MSFVTEELRVFRFVPCPGIRINRHGVVVSDILHHLGQQVHLLRNIGKQRYFLLFQERKQLGNIVHLLLKVITLILLRHMVLERRVHLIDGLPQYL